MINDIVWIRPKPLIYLDKNTQMRRYYPDFYLPAYDVYLDPKNNYVQKRDEDKIKRVQEQNNVKVFVLNKQQLAWKIIETIIAL